MKDIVKLEQVQRRATLFILQDASIDYRSMLINLILGIPPLMVMCVCAIYKDGGKEGGGGGEGREGWREGNGDGGRKGSVL